VGTSSTATVLPKPEVGGGEAEDIGTPESHKPTINQPTEGDTTVNGTGKPGDTVVITDKDGNKLGEGIVDGNGDYSIPVTDLPSGEEITATPSINGNVGTSSTATVLPKPEVGGGEAEDIGTPESHKPTINQPTEGDTTVTGTGKPGDTVVITDKDGNKLGEGVVDGNGDYSIPVTNLPSGEEITATPSINGNVGTPSTAIVLPKPEVGGGEAEDIGTSDSHKPTINQPTEGDTTVTGTGIPGDTVVITDKDGNKLGEGVVDGNGDYSIPVTDLPSGEEITATPSINGNVGTSSTATVLPKPEVGGGEAEDIGTPESHKPTINQPTEGDTTVTGTGKPGDTVVITDKDGNKLGEGVVDGNGDYSVVVPPLNKGEVITVTPSINGNKGTSTTTTVKNGKIPLENSLEKEKDIAKQAIDKVATETKNRIDHMSHLSDAEKEKLKESIDKIAKLGKETIDQMTTLDDIINSMKKTIEAIEKIGDICEQQSGSTNQSTNNHTTVVRPTGNGISTTNNKNTSSSSKLPKTGETADKTLIISGLAMLSVVGGAVYYRKKKEQA
ncbi:Ig-like domain-containing protein, partial [Vagococcus bubulae]